MRVGPILMQPEMVRATLDGRKGQTRRVMKPQPIGEPRPLSDWSRGLAAACHDHSPDPSKLAAHSEKLVGRIFPFTTQSGVLMSPSCPYGQPGDLLYVRESWALRLDQDHISPHDIPVKHRNGVGYWADGPGKCCNTGCAGAAGRVRASMHMPRWASRLTLRLTNVRVERVRDISDPDAISEGIYSSIDRTTNIGGHWTGIRASDGFEEVLTPGVPRCDYADLWDSINAKRGYSFESNPWVWVLVFDVIKKNVDEYLGEEKCNAPVAAI